MKGKLELPCNRCGLAYGMSCTDPRCEAVKIDNGTVVDKNADEDWLDFEVRTNPEGFERFLKKVLPPSESNQDA